MFKITIRIGDYISLAVMLLLVVALVAGQTENAAHETERSLMFKIHATEILQRRGNR